MEGYNSRIGKTQMQQYMGDLYENPMVVYREYIQNACDAIEDALSMNLIQDRKKSTIIVRIDTYNKTITIEDESVGISKDNIGPYLVDVASSKKVNRAGQYGIGRLNGANYCDQIIYETSYFGEEVLSTLVWDVKRAREICEDPSQNPTTEEIIDEVTHLFPEKGEKAETHYCRVTLKNVNNSLLLDQEKVISYISQIVPVDYDLDFKVNLLSPSLEVEANAPFKERFKSLWIYKISVNDIPVTKQYKSEDGAFKFGSLRCFSLIDNKTQEEYAWGWYAMNKEAKQMNDLPISFIRARHCNYQIGPATLLSGLYPSPVSQAYFIGELNLVHEHIRPTASRDGIKQNDHKIIFEAIVKRFFKEQLSPLYNKTSKFRSEVVERIAEANVQIASLVQLVKKEDDANEKTKLKEKIKKEKEKIATAEGKIPAYTRFFEETQSWGSATDVVSSVNETIVKAYNQKAEVVKNDSQIPAIKVERFKPETSEANTHDGGKTNNQQQGQGSKNSSNGENNNSQNGERDANNQIPTELDAYKALSSVERKLIKKFYSVIDGADVPPAMKEKMKKTLKKKILK